MKSLWGDGLADLELAGCADSGCACSLLAVFLFIMLALVVVLILLIVFFLGGLF